MSVYVIGDVQGCYDSLVRLLEKVKFDQSQDQLWFTGDLVNRGPKSLETLRFVRSLAQNAISVLGNHDLHFLAVAYGKRPSKTSVQLDKLLKAPDLPELLDWLRHLPFIHTCKETQYLMVHAGIPPQWTIKKAIDEAKQVESVLQSPKFTDLLQNMYKKGPNNWSESLQKQQRWRYTINALTRMRFCTAEGELNLKHKGKINDQIENYAPWFSFKTRQDQHQRIVFGHWSALGIKQFENVYCIDSGCVWGRQLSALRLDKHVQSENSLIQVNCNKLDHYVEI